MAWTLALLSNRKPENMLLMQLSSSWVSARHGPLQNWSVICGGTLIFPLSFSLYSSSQPL
ncbi:unnamed protein product, partial [Vitis vinifera]|uniref:Uncharacterized protein n=1 Tax=Vitis vinifera TaxID=29760 RepID=D7UA16_VITVI